MAEGARRSRAMMCAWLPPTWIESPHGREPRHRSGPRRRGACGRGGRDRAADARFGAVPDDAGQLGHERVDRDRRQGRRHDGDRDPGRDHLLHAGDGLAHDHRRQARADPGAQARLRHRVRHLRLRVADHRAGAEPGRAAGGLVGAGRRRGRADHARDRRAGRLELRPLPAAACLRARGFGGRDRGGGRAVDRRPVHHLSVLAVGVRRGSPSRPHHLGVHPPHRRHPAGGGRAAGPGGHRAVRAGPRAHRVRHLARRDVGVRPAQGRRPPLAGAVAGDLADPGLRGGLISYLFQYLLQAGLFFTVPLFLSVALGLSAVATGVRLLPLSVTLLLAAAGVPRLFPNASPRRVVQIGFFALFAGIVILLALLDIGAGPEVITWPMLLAGLGVGALASQLGSVTVSAVPDEQSGEVGGVQNTVTNLGASIGTALAGAVLISALTTSFFAGIENNPAVPHDVAAKAQVELAGGIPFLSDNDLKTQLDKAGVPPKTADAVVEENASARIDGLRSSLALLAVIALIALFATRRIPAQQPTGSPAADTAGEPPA